MNKSKTYLMPLFLKELKLDTSFTDQIQNTYLFHNSHLIDKCIGISFKPSILKNSKFIKSIQSLIMHDEFLEIEESDKEILYLFDFPEKYFQEYFKFMKGRYSQFSRRSKEIILSFWTDSQIRNKSSIEDVIYLKQVLFKDEKLRLKLNDELDVVIDKNAELGSIVEPEDELFISNKKESVQHTNEV